MNHTFSYIEYQSSPGSGVPLFTQLPRETVWKVSDTGQAPHQQPNHRSLDKRLCADAQPLVVLAHPSVLAQLCEGPLHYPPTRQDLSKPRRRGSSLCQSIFSPSLAHSSAQILVAIFSGARFGLVRCTTSTLRPNSFSTHSLPLPC
jgi:hypothetical protein